MTKFTPEQSIRVLVAEDYPPYRSLLVEALRSRPQFSIVEVADGGEAVRKAQEFSPGLILLDIGLPGLNGIEAARQIRRISPIPKIVFVTQERSIDIVEEAFAVGASAYVVKADAGRELMVAVDSVLRGEKYVSKTLERELTSTGIQGSGEIEAHHVFTPQDSPVQGDVRHHEVGFYSEDQLFIDDFARVSGNALKTGNVAIVVASESHQEQILGRLRAGGLDMRAAIDQGLYIPVDNREVVSAVMTDGLPDPARFHRLAESLLSKAESAVNGDRRRIVACGESAPVLWAQGNADGAVQLEHLWDEIARTDGLRISCGYSLSSFQGEIGDHVFGRICSEHSAFFSR